MLSGCCLSLGLASSITCLMQASRTSNGSCTATASPCSIHSLKVSSRVCFSSPDMGLDQAPQGEPHGQHRQTLNAQHFNAQAFRQPRGKYVAVSARYIYICAKQAEHAHCGQRSVRRACLASHRTKAAVQGSTCCCLYMCLYLCICTVTQLQGCTLCLNELYKVRHQQLQDRVLY